MTLDQLAIKHGTDKSSLHHDYCNIYASYLERKRDLPISLLELGFGGYEYPNKGGESAKMWLEYFPHHQSIIISTDIHFKNHADINDVRFVFMQLDQTNSPDDKLISINSDAKPMTFDIIIDDASHINRLSIQSFDLFFPMVKTGGIYICEDIEGSWYPDHGFEGTKDAEDYHFPSVVNYFRSLVNDINAQYIAGYVPRETAKDIKAIHFYRNTIIVLKK